MKWFIFLYLIPGIIVTGLFTPFIRAQGGDDYLRSTCNGYIPEFYGYLLALVSFIPVLNIAFAIILVFWYVLEIFNKNN